MKGCLCIQYTLLRNNFNAEVIEVQVIKQTFSTMISHWVQIFKVIGSKSKFYIFVLKCTLLEGQLQ
jgi:hypothetical protein